MIEEDQSYLSSAPLELDMEIDIKKTA